MRQKRVNTFFTFLYPGYWPGGSTPPDNAPHIAIPNDGEFVSITGVRYGGEQPSAVFVDPQQLRDLAHVLEEAADLFEENAAKAKTKTVYAYVAMFNPDWPNAAEHVALGEPCFDESEAIERCERAVAERYKFPYRQIHETWGADFPGCLGAGPHADFNLAYVNVRKQSDFQRK